MAPGDRQPRQVDGPLGGGRAMDWVGRLATVAAVVVASYWKIVDCETYMRLAIGRATVAAHLHMRLDPFLYSIPGLRWRNPEWLGDVLLWLTYRAGGETAVVLLKLVVLAVGWLLLYELARRRGGSPVVIVALALVILGGGEWHLCERNEMHLHWLVPAYGLALEAARRDRRWLWALLPLGLLWPNLHGSFPVSWVLVAAALAEALFGEDRSPARARALALVLLVHPLLPLVSPDGFASYSQVVDHLRYGAAIKRYIREWRPPDREAATLSQLPLHVLSLVGLASFLPRPNRRQVGGFLTFAAGLALGYSSQRFLLLFGLLALPVVAANLRRATAAGGDRLRVPGRAGALALLTLGVLLFAPAAYAARRCPSARDEPGYPVQAGRWIGMHAPPGSRLFMPYTGSQWLMWEAPQVGLYIDPHFSFDASFMIRFFEQLMPSPARFEDEVARLDVNLALVDLVGESRSLYGHLDADPRWRLVYFDGFYALYARRVPRNDALVAAQGYGVLRARLGFDYLGGAADEALAPELLRLQTEAPAVARALEGYRLLRVQSSAADHRARGGRASALLASAMDELPSTPALIGYLVEAQILAGDTGAAMATLRKGVDLFPQSTRLRALAAILPEKR